MAYPTLTPSARDYSPGDWAVKTFNAMSGAEVRLRYGDRRFNATFKLEYSNIRDTDAALFLAHYNQTLGSFHQFVLPAEVLQGWGSSSYLPPSTTMQFRYDAPPTVVSVRPGRSTVTVTLRGVV